MAAVGESTFMRRLAKGSTAVVAISWLLEHVAGLLRQLVHVAGWLVLLFWTVSLLFRPDLSVTHLITPGAGVLAVAQGHVKGRRPEAQVVLPSEALERTREGLQCVQATSVRGHPGTRARTRRPVDATPAATQPADRPGDRASRLGRPPDPSAGTKST